jgi:hypothetical protein
MTTRSRLLTSLALLSLTACPKDDPGTATEATGTTAETAGTTMMTGIILPTSTGEVTTTSTGTDPDPTTTMSMATTTVPETGGIELPCGSKDLMCGDGIDNDRDGFVDLDDPECTGPCDNDEGSFQTGIPGDNVDCKQDCFFDGNSGQGDGCTWDLKCDPANPGANINCEYTGGNNCKNMMASEECKMNCQGLVPNGCDCYGCCTVQTPDGDKNIFLNSGPECTLLNLDGCMECTPQTEDCGNDCKPEDCELCFGEDELPEGCDDPGGCDPLPTCIEQTDCPEGSFCVTGCCVMPTP